MDGAGRLARSRRSQGPQTDLKAAAIGAVILLRERLARKRAVTQPSIGREPPHRLIAAVERYLPNRAGVALTVLLLAGSAAFGIVKGGHLDDFISALSDTRNALANSAGFRITTVAINGRKQLTQDEVLASGGVNGRSSLLFLDAAAVRDRLKANPWIADATVLKLYPGQLQIDIVERSAFALWQQDGRLSVISDDGTVLILLSDGNDTISGTSARQAMDSVIGTGALLYTVNSNPATSPHTPSSSARPTSSPKRKVDAIPLSSRATNPSSISAPRM